MSDLLESVGMVFADAGSSVVDFASSFLNDAASMFDSGATDTAATDVAAAAPDASAATPPPDVVPPEQPPAPVSEGSTALSGAESSVPTTSAASSPSWFQNLSPGAQAILGRSVAGGAAGVIAALSQKHLLDEQKRREDQKREDKIRRSYVPAIGEGAFKPRGVIDSAKGG